ncbi:MAG: nodulation protein NfeD [Candidatus Omnitrophica bacterium]|nr:nodulation protein NfeD [Candidatus Omnitrophota bacterium]
MIRKTKRMYLIFALSCIFVLLSAPLGYSQSRKINVVTIDNYIINPVTRDYITEAIETTQKDNDICLLIQLDTPGGLLEATRDIVKKMMNADIPIVVYVAPSGGRAASAGLFITLASHVAAMAPSTNIGAAHPVALGIGAPKFDEKDKEAEKFNFSKKDKKQSESPDAMADKIMNDTIAWVTTIAKNRNRNVDWSIKAVTESVSATEKEAQRLKVVDFIADDLDQLVKKLHGLTIKTKTKEFKLDTENSQINFIELSTQQKILNSLINPNIAYIFMLLGFLGLLFEFTHPGIGFPGIAGLIAIILAFYAFQALPVNYAGVALIILAIILFIAEAMTPTFGLLTLGGLVAMTLGSLMLFNSKLPFLRVSLNVIIPIVLASSLIIIFLMSNVIKAHRKKVAIGPETMIGKEATVYSQIRKKGKVFFDGMIWNAISTSTIGKGQKVIIEKIDGLTLTVKAKKKEKG